MTIAADVKFPNFPALVPLLIVLCVASCFSHAQIREVLCNKGDGGFRAKFRTGVAVEVKAARIGPLATRACEATLAWDRTTLTVATMAPYLDLEAFGVDLGLGVPVVAFQVTKSDANCCSEYRILSLNKPPQLLRTVTGGQFFTSQDLDLDGRVEIWTNDAAAWNEFDSLTAAELDAPPTIVLRFEHGDLMDVSSEFQSYFDDQIARIRGTLDLDTLRIFKKGDGKLVGTSEFPPDQLHRLREAKGKVLAIVSAYLYSARGRQAWQSLAEMWPAGDVERIRAAILSAQAKGISAQASRPSAPAPATAKKPLKIFDAASVPSENNAVITTPEPILLRMPVLPGNRDQPSSRPELLLEMLIDSAGKVRSVQPVGRTTPGDETIIWAASEWKFIPAFRGKQAVACRNRLEVSLRQ